MASITSLSNSMYNTSSIYGNRNILSGLASGMDTEQMIENAVSGIKMKIQNLQKKRTKIEWQQEAYRSIIDKMVGVNQKYTSYASSTNLMSNSFFNNAVNSVAKGTYKDKVSASGKTSSDVSINAVRQLATAASYTVSGLGGARSGELQGITGGKSFDIAGKMNVSNVSGSLSFQYGGANGASFDISFGELEDLNEVKVFNADGTEKKDAGQAEKLAQAIRNKLGEITYNYTKNGFEESTTADKAIQVEVDETGGISFKDALGSGNAVKISSAAGEIKNIVAGNTLAGSGDLTREVDTLDYISNKELSVTFNGSTKKISMTDVINGMGSGTGNDDFQKALQKELDSAFGSGKVKVGMQDGKLSLTPQGQGDTMILGGSAVEGLGFQTGDANYINTSKKLTDLLGEDKARELFSPENRLGAVGLVNTAKMVDEAGNKVMRDESGNYYQVDSEGKALYNFKVNGANINVTGDTTLESLMNSINSNADAGVKVSYSRLTNEFKFTATETGSNSKIEFGGLAKELFGDTAAAANAPDYSSAKLSEVLGADYAYGSEYANFTMNVKGEGFSVHVDENSTMESIVKDLNDMLSAVGEADPKYKGVQASFDGKTNSIVFKDADGKAVEASAGGGTASALFDKMAKTSGGSYTAGQDAIMDVTINGKRFESLTRSSNSFDVDGMTINVKGTFETGADEEPVTFETSADSDKIVDAIKAFVDDYNEMITELKNAYSTLPAQKSNGARYEPLTAEEEDSYSESELRAYNEKAKQGILFGDRDLSRAYDRLRSAISPSGADGQILREIGLDTSYSGGLTTISLDESKLRAALESDPDKVRNAFTKSKENGSSSDGLMTTMKNTLEAYARTTGEPKGILIQQAGSIRAPASLNSNSLLSQMNNIDSQIDRWQTKMSNQIDRYTNQFSKLEQLIAQMNSQSSALAGLMGGYSGSY